MARSKSYLLKNVNNEIFESDIKIIVVLNTNFSLGNTLFCTKLNKYIRYNTYMSSYHSSVFVGILLGDAMHIEGN